MELLSYKGYEGTAEVDLESEVCFGRILFIADLITYESDTPKGLKEAFAAALDDYLETCKRLGKSPDKPLKGAFNVRVPPELHKAAVLAAVRSNGSLNDIVVKAMDTYLNGPKSIQNVTNYFLHTDKPKYKSLESKSSEVAPRWVRFSHGSPEVHGGN